MITEKKYSTWLLTFLSCLTVFGCKPKETTLSGEVFIVLKSRETLKLSLVEVCLIDKTAARAILARKESLQSAIASLQIEVRRLSETNVALSDNIRLARKNVDDCKNNENEYADKAERELSGHSLSIQNKILADPNFLGQEYYFCLEQVKMWRRMGGRKLRWVSPLRNRV
jgi:hypothetical protein